MNKKISLFLLILATLLFSYDLIILPDTISYNQQKSEILKEKRVIQKAYASGKISIDSVGKQFEEMLVSELVPYWYGLDWDFEGHTNSPDSGTIACGYFVSTTLKHMGLNLNRYRLAQQAALNEVRSLAISSKLVRKYVYHKDLTTTLLKDFDDGLYIVGLDCHVGYLLKKEKKLYFIHSSYLDPVKVVIEEADHSEAWHSTELYYFAPISGNQKLMKRWLSGGKITILK